MNNTVVQRQKTAVVNLSNRSQQSAIQCKQSSYTTQPFHSISSASSSSTSSCSNSENNTNNTNSYNRQQANELSYKNYQLQQALKAATAALQKSKIKSTTNLLEAKLNTSTNQHSFKPYSKPELNKMYRNTLVIETTPSFDVNKVNTSDYDNIDEDNIDISVNLNCLKEDLSTANKVDENEIVISTLLSSSSASRTSSLSSASSTTSSSNRSSSKSYNSLNTNGLKSAFSNINLNSDKTNELIDRTNSKKLQKKHKSASIDHLNNVASTSPAISCQNITINYEEPQTTNDLNTAEYAYFYDNLNRTKLPPPPHIQPFSGVLSKSLFSVVLKPQPVKPVVNNAACAVKTTLGSDSNLINKDDFKSNFRIINRQQTPPLTQPSQSTSILFRNKLLVKKKCVSTTNLKFENKSPVFQSSANHKSFAFLDEKDHLKEVDNYEQLEIVVNKDSSNRINDLELSLKQKTTECNQLKLQLKSALEQNQLCQRQREISLEELEEEKQIYEQKLNAMRVHFNQQLNYFEQNERQCMTERIQSLTQCYNDLKMNYQKNLDIETKHLKQKLNDSQLIQSQLVKQIQDSQQHSKCNCIKQQKQSIKNDQQQTDLLLVLKQIKHENNELKFQLNAQRDKFQNEKDKWNNEKLKVIQFQTYLQQNQPNNQKGITNKNLTIQQTVLQNQPNLQTKSQQVQNTKKSVNTT